jgi:NAD(P)-dependent dehydrogenase (short-subunit alcohol dehydrogenase family)
MNAGYDIQDKTALITGANRGIGRAILESFLSNGIDKVYAAVRNPDSASPLVEKYGDRVIPIKMDLNEPETVVGAAALTQDVEIVVNNAGILTMTTPLDRDAIESLESEMTTNVFGLIRMAQAFAPVLKQNGGGVFIQLNSIASIKCFSFIATYSASKAAAYSVTQALREQLREQGTLVLSVHPGPIDTDMGAAAGFSDFSKSPSIVAESIVAAIRAGDFHVFPDSMAQRVGDAYRSYAESIVDVDLIGA